MIQPSVCLYCHRAFRSKRLELGEPAFCCTGCALASRLPIDGETPVTRGLVAALALGFGFFNEVLFWIFAVAFGQRGILHLAKTFAQISLTLGGIMPLMGAWLLMRAPGRRVTDVIVIIFVAGIWAAGLAGGSARFLVGANLVMLGWLIRGWCKKKMIWKKSDPV